MREQTKQGLYEITIKKDEQADWNDQIVFRNTNEGLRQVSGW